MKRAIASHGSKEANAGPNSGDERATAGVNQADSGME
jgi:hypothetical protein